jgi:hypothetical protein
MVGYERMIELARSTLPMTITPDGHPSPQEDWRVIRSAFVARIARTAESLSALVPLGARLDAIDLARSVFDHVLHLAWIGADSEARFPIWLKKDFQSRLDYDKKVRKRLTSGTESRWSEQPLSDEDRAAYRAHVRAVGRDLPGLPQMAIEADQHWLSRYPAGLANSRTMSFVDQYEHIYDAYSWMAHPRLTGLQAFWDFLPQWTIVRTHEVGDRAHDPLHMGQLLVGHGVLMSSLIRGVPSMAHVLEALSRNADLAEAARAGRLSTVEDSPGSFRVRFN